VILELNMVTLTILYIFPCFLYAFVKRFAFIIIILNISLERYYYSLMSSVMLKTNKNMKQHNCFQH